MDRQQNYLVSQLLAAFAGEYETGDYKRPTLRSFSMLVLFPAYIQNTFKNLAGWILAVPILTAIEKEFLALPSCISSFDRSCVESVLCMIACIVDALRSALDDCEVSGCSP